MVTLLSGGAVGAVATNLISGSGLKLLSAAVVLIAGVISLATTHFLDDNEIEKMFEGAGKLLMTPEFIELREQANERKAARQKVDGLTGASGADDERDKKFREGAQLAYGKLSDLKKRFSDAVGYEHYFSELRDGRP